MIRENVDGFDVIKILKLLIQKANLNRVCLFGVFDEMEEHQMRTAQHPCICLVYFSWFLKRVNSGP